MRALLLAAALAAASLATAAEAGADTVESGRIEVGRGAGGIHLGMTRDQVVDRIGSPEDENENGWMTWSGSENIFDAYLTHFGDPLFVRQIVVAGGRFRIGSRLYVFRRGAVRKLLRRYEGRLRRTRTDISGDPIYRLKTRYLGHITWTDFFVTRHHPDALVTNVILLWPNQ